MNWFSGLFIGFFTRHLSTKVLALLLSMGVFLFVQASLMGTQELARLTLDPSLSEELRQSHILLTGKFDESTEFHEKDFRRKWQTDPEQNAIYRQDLAKVKQLAPLARDGRTLAQAALQFTLSHDAVSTVIPGAKNAQQVRANLPGVPFTAADRALIDQVTPPGGGRKIWPA